MHLRVLLGTVVLNVAFSGVLAVVAPKTAEAIPAFSRQTEKSCSTCHNAIPNSIRLDKIFERMGSDFQKTRSGKTSRI